MSKMTSETPQGKWLGGTQKNSFWLCCAEPLAERRKSGISGNWHRPKPIPWGRNSWESWERGKMSQRQNEGREYTDLGLDLGEREKPVACHASVLALVMIDEARVEAEM